MKRVAWAALAALVVSMLTADASAAGAVPKVTVGSKAFPESWILGDALAQLVNLSRSAVAEHKKNLGGTEIAYQALVGGDIDVYAEYTGTIAEVILKRKGQPPATEMQRWLRDVGLGMSAPLGFNDNTRARRAVRPATTHLEEKSPILPPTRRCASGSPTNFSDGPTASRAFFGVMGSP